MIQVILLSHPFPPIIQKFIEMMSIFLLPDVFLCVPTLMSFKHKLLIVLCNIKVR